MGALGPPSGQDLILVVDDDRTMRMLARQSLEVAGFRVVEADGGKEALRALDAQHPSLVLLDVDMPDLDGFSVCARLRERSHARDTPVLVMTGLNDVDSVRRAYEVGATDFVGKPPNWVILSHRVRYMLRASRAIANLRSSEAKLANAQSLANLGWWEWDVGSGEFAFSSRLWSLLGGDPESPQPGYQALLERVDEADRSRVRRVLDQLLRDGGTLTVDYQTRPEGDRGRVIHQQTRVTLDETGAPAHVAAVVQDITDRKRDEEQIRFLAYFDGLTGLPNRRLFRDRLDLALDAARRHGRLAAVLFLDLDRFKRINDTLGHGAGDQLLKTTAERLEACLRRSDCVGRPGAQDTEPLVARLGGDEFIILLGEVRKVQDAARVARRMVDALTHPFTVNDQEVTVTASIGIAIFPHDAEDAEGLLKNADTAMYHAKDQGRNNYQFYTESMNATAFERLVLEGQLRRALEQQEFVLHYQPQLDTITGRVLGAEALIRWQHPELGLVPPMGFIPIAEESGLVVPMGEWALNAACAQAVAWRVAGVPPLRISVNVSGRQFGEAQFVDTVAAALGASGLAPQLLDLELTETAVMGDAEENIRTLDRLKELGVRLSVDDFGTGYSSLSYLKRFPLDALKIDRSFLSGVPGDPDNVAITAAIIAMARSLRLDLIAEGVETAEQLAFIRDHGCQEYQGYLVSPPVSADRFLALLRDTRGASPAPSP